MIIVCKGTTTKLPNKSGMPMRLHLSSHICLSVRRRIAICKPMPETKNNKGIRHTFSIVIAGQISGHPRGATKNPIMAPQG
jgi:hypothetical protein